MPAHRRAGLLPLRPAPPIAPAAPPRRGSRNVADDDSMERPLYHVSGCGGVPYFWGLGVVTTLPASPDAFKDATWDDVLPHYQELASRQLDRDNVEAWLADWSR